MSEDINQDYEEQEESTDVDYKSVLSKKDKAIEDLRREKEELAEKLSSFQESQEDDAQVTDIESIAEKAAQSALQKIKQEKATEYKSEASTWMQEQKWGEDYSSEKDPEGKKVSELNRVMAKIEEATPSRSAEEYKENLRAAHDLLNRRMRRQSSAPSDMAAGGGGSDVRREMNSGDQRNAKESRFHSAVQQHLGKAK
jgi:hypothetical protein